MVILVAVAECVKFVVGFPPGGTGAAWLAGHDRLCGDLQRGRWAALSRRLRGKESAAGGTEPLAKLARGWSGVREGAPSGDPLRAGYLHAVGQHGTRAAEHAGLELPQLLPVVGL